MQSDQTLHTTKIDWISKNIETFTYSNEKFVRLELKSASLQTKSLSLIKKKKRDLSEENEEQTEVFRKSALRKNVPFNFKSGWF